MSRSGNRPAGLGGGPAPGTPRGRRTGWAVVGALSGMLCGATAAAQPAPPQPCDTLAQLPRETMGPSALVDGVPNREFRLRDALRAYEAAVASFPDEMRFRAWLGRALIWSDAPAGLAMLRAAAEAGKPAAQHLLGAALARSMGTTADDTAAILWHRRAAEQGLPEAQFVLGT